MTEPTFAFGEIGESLLAAASQAGGALRGASRTRAPSAPCSVQSVIDAKGKRPRMGTFSFGADDGNRTRVSGLGSERSAIELHLRAV